MEGLVESKSENLLSGCLARIKGSYASLRPSEQKVADVIIKSPQRIIHLSVGELARLSEVSEATIVRFCQNIGYSGFQSLKMSLAQDVAVPMQFIPQEITLKDDLNEIISKVSHSNLQAISDTTEILDKGQLERAIEVISNARRIEFCGVGFSGLVAQDAAIRLRRIGLNTISYEDPHLQANSAALLSKEDVLVGVSLLGKTADILYSLKQAKLAGATTISLTQYSKNPISEIADINLYTTTENELFRTGASRIAQLHVVDILYAAIAVRRYDKSIECIKKTKRIGVEKRV